MAVRKSAREWTGMVDRIAKISLRIPVLPTGRRFSNRVDYGVNWTDVDCRELNVDVTGFNFADSPDEDGGVRA